MIADEIKRHQGWIPFDRYMELALYTPGLGYYSGGKRVIGHIPQDGSDFVTAPELTPLFGETLARQVGQALEATGTDEIWEFGAGTGALAEQLLSVLGDRIKRYTIVDLSGTLRDRQHQRIIKQQPELAHKVIWADSLPDQFDGVVVGNEVLDAMPVKLLHLINCILGDQHSRVLRNLQEGTPEQCREALRQRMGLFYRAILR
jgi:SAM-dependent MidA family methyltransferase